MVTCRCASTEKTAQKGERLMLEEAHLPQRYGQEIRTFQNFTVDKANKEAYERCLAFVRGESTPCLVLMGELGSGKTHLLEAVGRACLAKGERVKYEVAPDLLDKIRATYSEHSQTTTAALLEEYRRAPLLILDDLGAEYKKAANEPAESVSWAVEAFYKIVDERYRNGRRLLVATNAFVDKADRDRIWSRLLDLKTGVATQVSIESSSYRV